MPQKADSSLPLTVALMTFNRSAYLKEAIGGILAQTWQDFELLILDNASTDDTPEVVLGIRDERIRYVRNPPGFTAYFNGTSAIQIARGKRIIITHDDDVMHPTLLAKQMAMMEAHPGMTAVWTNTSVIDQAGNTIQAFSTPQGNDRIYGIGEFIARFPQENLLPLPSTLMFERARYPRKLIGQCYYDRQRGKTQPRTHGGDDILFPAIMNTFGPVAFLNEPLLKYRRHGIQDGNRTHLSLGILNTYRILRRFAGKLPNKDEIVPLMESHLARFTAQHEVIHRSAPQLPRNTREKLKSCSTRHSRHAHMTPWPPSLCCRSEFFSHKLGTAPRFSMHSLRQARNTLPPCTLYSTGQSCDKHRKTCSHRYLNKRISSSSAAPSFRLCSSTRRGNMG